LKSVECQQRWEALFEWPWLSYHKAQGTGGLLCKSVGRISYGSDALRVRYFGLAASGATGTYTAPIGLAGKKSQGRETYERRRGHQ
jgi:hypothetical protein